MMKWRFGSKQPWPNWGIILEVY